MFSRLKRKLDRAWFDLRCKAVYTTPIVKCDPDSEVMILSQLYHPDLTMYMLAAKSFARFLRPKGFVIVDDGLTQGDKDVLRAHFEHIQFVPSEAMRDGACPVGGCWERLLALSAFNKDHYVIQLDADTLTISAPEEVLQCVAAGRTFTLGTSSGTHFVSFDEASRHAHAHDSSHVQNRAERALGQYPGKESMRYVRGCAGFTGFAKGQLARNRIEEFSGQMEALIGAAKWREWGSEQVTSNYMAANVPDAMVLPVDRYPFWAPSVSIKVAALLHFFGTFRYSAGMYLRQARKVIACLNNGRDA